jgi:hypothetical protein
MKSFNQRIVLNRRRADSYTGEEIRATGLQKPIPASLDSVWNVIADIDKEPEFWHGTKSIRKINKRGNTV